MGPHAADLLYRPAVARPVLSHPGRLLRPRREGVAQLRPQGKETDVVFLVLVMCVVCVGVFFSYSTRRRFLLILKLNRHFYFLSRPSRGTFCTQATFHSLA